MNIEFGCIYRYFLYQYNYQFQYDMESFRQCSGRSENKTLSSFHNLVVVLNKSKFDNKTTINKAYELTHFLAKYAII